MRKNWHDEAWDQYLNWQKEDKRYLKKINSIIKDIDRNGYNCSSHLEPLKGNLSGYYSVKIDDKNRIVFRIINNDKEYEMEILQCGSHYGDK